MDYSTRPCADNLIIIAQILFRCWSIEASLTFFVNESSFFILDDLATENWIIHVLNFLKHLFTILCHFLIHKLAWVNVVFHKLLCAAELDVLIHELRHVFFIIHELNQVLLHDCVLVRGSLEPGQWTHPIAAYTFVFIDLVDTLPHRKLLE